MKLLGKCAFAASRTAQDYDFLTKFHPVAAFDLKRHIIRGGSARVVAMRAGRVTGIGGAGMRNVGPLGHHRRRNGQSGRVVVFVPSTEVGDQHKDKQSDKQQEQERKDRTENDIEPSKKHHTSSTIRPAVLLF